MSHRRSARIANNRIPRILVAVLLVVLAVGAGVVGYPMLSSSSSAVVSHLEARRSEQHGLLGVADGAVPDGTTVFDDQIPAVARLDPALLAALRHAATDAADSGVEFVVNSGWRSRSYQKQLFQEAVEKYGSAAEAARWVATPATSVHVSGDAIDLGPFHATAWLSAHGAAYGLCRIYRNEPWHYELRSRAVRHGCPAAYADPTHDPRMRR